MKGLAKLTYFNVAGKLFHTIGPEYIKLCLNLSFFGLGGIKLEEIVDLKSGIFSSNILWLNISFIYGGVSDLSTLNMNLNFLRNNPSKTVRIFKSSIPK